MHFVNLFHIYLFYNKYLGIYLINFNERGVWPKNGIITCRLSPATILQPICFFFSRHTAESRLFEPPRERKFVQKIG